MDDWAAEADAPTGHWLLTRREGEDGFNICALRIWPDGEREWVESGPNGRSTITHHGFAAPTHWQYGNRA
jgi:hypothetical protein